MVHRAYEGGKEVGTPSNSVGKQRRRRGRTTFNSTKQRLLRDQKRREGRSSNRIDRQLLWRLGCKIHSIHLESIPKEEEATSSASRGELALTAMAEQESKQPLLIAQSDSKDIENEHNCENSEVYVSIEK